MKKMTIVFAAWSLASCSPPPQIIDAPSATQSSRINYLVIHFTAEHFAESMRLLTEVTDRPASVHYLVPEPGDETYTLSELRVHRLVDESRRAQHAGTSFWGGTRNLNDSSIGIEIVNRSSCETVSPDGKITTPVKGAMLIGDGPEALRRISMVGNDLELDSGVGTCGKEGQSVPVGVGQPTLKIDELTVGGTA